MGAPDLSQYLWPDVAQGRQPQYAAAPDRANVFGKACVAVAVPSVGGYDTATPAVLAFASNVGQEISRNGRVWTGNSANSSVIRQGPNGYGALVSVTAPIAIGARILLTSTADQYFASDTNAGGGSNSLNVGLAGNRWICDVRDPGGTHYSISGTVAPVMGRHDILFQHVPGIGMFLYEDGLLIASDASNATAKTSTRYNGAGRPCWLALGEYPTALGWVGSLELGFVLAGDFRASAPALASNPYQLFAPPASIYFPSGAITVPTLSLATMSGITSTGGYPQVTRA